MTNSMPPSAYRRRLLPFVAMLLLAGLAIAADRAVKCIWCHGAGMSMGKPCTSCNGTGTRWERTPEEKDKDADARREQASKCIWCHGTGTSMGKPCTSCNGTGTRWDQPTAGGGDAKQAVKCIWCHGTGVNMGKPCSSCNGTGKAWK